MAVPRPDSLMAVWNSRKATLVCFQAVYKRCQRALTPIGTANCAAGCYAHSDTDNVFACVWRRVREGMRKFACDLTNKKMRGFWESLEVLCIRFSRFDLVAKLVVLALLIKAHCDGRISTNNSLANGILMIAWYVILNSGPCYTQTWECTNPRCLKGWSHRGENILRLIHLNGGAQWAFAYGSR